MAKASPQTQSRQPRLGAARPRPQLALFDEGGPTASGLPEDARPGGTDAGRKPAAAPGRQPSRPTCRRGRPPGA
mgnify:CR=1 FL=1